MISRRAVIAAAGLFSAGALAPGLARAAGRVPAPLPAFPLSIAVTEEEAGKLVRDDAWIDAQIADAVRLFEPAGVTPPLERAGARPRCCRACSPARLPGGFLRARGSGRRSRRALPRPAARARRRRVGDRGRSRRSR